MSSKLFIAHIGFPKCASSSLQLNLFSTSKNFQYIGPNNLSNVTGDLNIEIKNKHTKIHNQILEYVNGDIEDSKELKKKLNSVILEDDHDVIFSSEWITGCRFVKNKPTDRIKLLSDIIPFDSKIILVCRKHIDLIKSLYRDHQYLDNKKYLKFEEFTKEILSESFIDKLKYQKIHEALIKYFNPKNIYIYNLENSQGEDITYIINKDWNFSKNNKSQALKLINSGVSYNQFNYLKLLRNISFLKNIIPKFLYLPIHQYLMLKFSSENKLKIDISENLIKRINNAFANDWEYITQISK